MQPQTIVGLYTIAFALGAVAFSILAIASPNAIHKAGGRYGVLARVLWSACAGICVAYALVAFFEHDQAKAITLFGSGVIVLAAFYIAALILMFVYRRTHRGS